MEHGVQTEAVQPLLSGATISTDNSQVGVFSARKNTNNISNGTDYCEIDGKVYIFDHSNHEGTLENLTDGDGFGIRNVVDFGRLITKQELRILDSIITNGGFANNRTIDDAVAKVRDGKDSGTGNSWVSSRRRTKMADVSLASQNDGRGDGQEA